MEELIPVNPNSEKGKQWRFQPPPLEDFNRLIHDEMMARLARCQRFHKERERQIERWLMGYSDTLDLSP